MTALMPKSVWQLIYVNLYYETQKPHKNQPYLQD